MRGTSRAATTCAYLGALMLVIGFYPGLDDLTPYALLHAMWHLWLLVGAGLLIYGLETLRGLARRHRRMTM